MPAIRVRGLRKSYGAVEAVAVDHRGAVVRTLDPTPVLHALTGWVLEHGVELQGLSVTRPTLEDVYLELTTMADG